MTRTIEEIEGDLVDAIDAMRRPHLVGEADAAYAALKHELAEALALRRLEELLCAELDRLVAAGEAEKTAPGEYRPATRG